MRAPSGGSPSPFRAVALEKYVCPCPLYVGRPSMHVYQLMSDLFHCFGSLAWNGRVHEYDYGIIGRQWNSFLISDPWGKSYPSL